MGYTFAKIVRFLIVIAISLHKCTSNTTIFAKECFSVNLWLLRLLNYLQRSFREEHWPSTKLHQRTRLWRHGFRSYACSSASVSHLQEFLGRPFFLLPWGFQVRTWRVRLDGGFLKVCPIESHFQRLICISIRSCPAFLYR